MNHSDWRAAWQPMINAVGTEFDAEPARFVADRIEASALRRYLEPLEFDCPLHYDSDVARELGYTEVVVPCSALVTFAYPPMWRPGEQLFTDSERNAQPSGLAISGFITGLEPETVGFFATNFEADYLHPALVGDRLARVGALLVACEPKETSVGRGAFLTWQSNIVNDRHQLIARFKNTFYRYVPHDLVVS